MALFADRRKRIVLYTFIGLLLLVGLFYKYYNVYEEMQVKQFFNLIVARDYQSAYKMWQAPPSYRYTDFLEDWGDNSYYAGGKITSFRIESSHSKGNFVLIKVLLNGDKEVSLFISKVDKHFSFAP